MKGAKKGKTFFKSLNYHHQGKGLSQSYQDSFKVQLKQEKIEPMYQKKGRETDDYSHVKTTPDRTGMIGKGEARPVQQVAWDPWLPITLYEYLHTYVGTYVSTGFPPCTLHSGLKT